MPKEYASCEAVEWQDETSWKPLQASVGLQTSDCSCLHHTAQRVLSRLLSPPGA